MPPPSAPKFSIHWTSSRYTGSVEKYALMAAPVPPTFPLRTVPPASANHTVQPFRAVQATCFQNVVPWILIFGAGDGGDLNAVFPANPE